MPTIITITDKLGFKQTIELYAKDIEYIPYYQDALPKRGLDDDRKILDHIEINIEY